MFGAYVCEIAGELLDGVNRSHAFDFDCHPPRRIRAEQIDRADRSEVLATNQAHPLAKNLRGRGQSLLKVALDAVLLQAGVLTHVV